MDIIGYILQLGARTCEPQFHLDLANSTEVSNLTPAPAASAFLHKALSSSSSSCNFSLAGIGNGQLALWLSHNLNSWRFESEPGQYKHEVLSPSWLWWILWHMQLAERCVDKNHHHCMEEKRSTSHIFYMCSQVAMASLGYPEKSCVFLCLLGSYIFPTLSKDSLVLKYPFNVDSDNPQFIWNI